MKNDSDNTQQSLLLFSVGDQLCALSLAYLTEVKAPVVATALPFVPKFVDGLVNISGQIMPQVNALCLLGKSQPVQTLLVLNIQHIAVVLGISHVLETLIVADNDIVAYEGELAGIGWQYQHQQQTVLVFDAARLLTCIHAQAQASGKSGFLGQVKQTQQKQQRFYDFLFVRVAENTYALALEEIDEIIELASLAHQPRAPQSVLGVSIIRDEPRLILSLASLLQKPRQQQATQRGVAIIIELEDMYLGVLVDGLLGMVNLAEDKVRAKVVENTQGQLIPRLKLDELLSAHLHEIRPFIPLARKRDRRELIQLVDFLRFTFAGDTYVIETQHVQRIVNNKAISALLAPHAWIIGTTEVDGKILPVIDLRAQLGYQSNTRELQEMVIIHDGKQLWALAIELTNEIIMVDKESIDYIASTHSKYISAFIPFEQQVLTMLDVQKICADNMQATG